MNKREIDKKRKQFKKIESLINQLDKAGGEADIYFYNRDLVDAISEKKKQIASQYITDTIRKASPNYDLDRFDIQTILRGNRKAVNELDLYNIIPDLSEFTDVNNIFRQFFNKFEGSCWSPSKFKYRKNTVKVGNMDLKGLSKFSKFLNVFLDGKNPSKVKSTFDDPNVTDGPNGDKYVRGAKFFEKTTDIVVSSPELARNISMARKILCKVEQNRTLSKDIKFPIKDNRWFEFDSNHIQCGRVLPGVINSKVTSCIVGKTILRPGSEKIHIDSDTLLLKEIPKITETFLQDSWNRRYYSDLYSTGVQSSRYGSRAMLDKSPVGFITFSMEKVYLK